MARFTTRRIVAGLGVMGAAGAIAVPAVDGASSRKVSTTVKTKGIPAFTGTASGKPYGSGTVRGRIDLPNITSTLKYGNGSVRIKATVTSASPISGTWRTTSGTGKYRKVSGSGKFTGTLKGTSATLRFTGRIKP